LAVLGLAGWVTCATPPTTPTWQAEYDVTSRPPEAIPPGTVVGQTPPEGWSNIVIKSLPRVRPADRPKVKDLVARMAEWMFTAFLADVRSDPSGSPPRRLRAVALGLGCSVHGRDTIITPENPAGAKLDWITRTILTKGYERQKQAVVVFQGATAGLVDTPVWFRVDGKHRLVRFRYALLVDGPGGPLDTLAWQLDAAGKLADPPACVWLKPDTIDTAELFVDPNEFTLGVPSEAAFAVDGLPPGRSLGDLPAALRPLAATTRFTPETARDLEAGLRRFLTDAGKGP
jgi:hypothetical protein